MRPDRIFAIGRQSRSGRGGGRKIKTVGAAQKRFGFLQIPLRDQDADAGAGNRFFMEMELLLMLKKNYLMLL